MNSGVAISNGAVVSKTAIAAGNLTFVPGTNGTGPAYDSFTFKVQDDGGTANGGQDTDPTARVMTISVTSVNDRSRREQDDSDRRGRDLHAALWGGQRRLQLHRYERHAAKRPAERDHHGRATSGTLKNAGTAITSFPATLNIGDFAANNITFTPSANLNSTATPTFNLVFKVQDDGGTAFGPDANGPDIDTDAIAQDVDIQRRREE